MQKYALYSRTPDGKPQRNQKGVNRIVMSVVTYFYDGKEYKKAADRREKEYREF